MKERTIFISGDIEQESTDIIIAQLLWLDSIKKKKEISLYINSSGGEVACMFGLYDVMNFISSPIKTVVIGKACSAAAILLAAGTKGRRMALPNSSMMIHQPSIGGIGGQVTDMVLEAKQLEDDKRRMIEIIARHCGQTFDRVKKTVKETSISTQSKLLYMG